MPFFDVETDAALLRPAYNTPATRARVTAVLPIVEADVLGQFADTEDAVQLIGFNWDPEACASRLRLALKATIADVLAWRMAQWDAPVTMSSKGNSEAGNDVYRADAAALFPTGWDARLTPFRIKPEMPEVWGF